jgi:hypothetical protein
LAIATYLLIAARWAPDLSEVARVVGVSPFGVDVVATASAFSSAMRSGVDPNAILAAAKVLSALGVADQSKIVIDRLSVLADPTYAPLVDELKAAKPNPRKVQELLRALQPAQLNEVQRVVGDVGRQVAIARALRQRPMVVIMSPKQGKRRRGSDNVLLAFESLLTGPSGSQPPIYVDSNRFAAAKSWAKCRCHHGDDCGAPPAEGLNGIGTEVSACQAVLAVEASENDSQGRLSAELELILPPGAAINGANLTNNYGDVFPPGGGDDVLSAQEGVAEAAFRWLAGRFDYLSGLPRLELAPRTLLVASRSRDVAVTGGALSTFNLAELRGRGLSIVGQCPNQDFQAGLEHVLRSKEDIVGRLAADGTRLRVPKLTLEQDGRYGCVARLEHGGHDLLRLSGLVSESPWREAGAGVGNDLLAYYQPQVPAHSRWPRASTALVLSGLPQLSDDRPSNNGLGWGLAATDLALLAAGVFTVAVSVDQRNSFSDSSEPAQIDRANRYLHVGTVLLSAVLVERIFSGIAYGFGWWDANDSRSGQPRQEALASPGTH